MDEFEQYKRKPLISTSNNDFEQYRRQKQKEKSFGEKLPAWLLGLGQFGEDTLMGQVTGTAEPEVDIPDIWKPERIRRENKSQRNIPSLNLEQYVEPGKEGQFNVGRYGPALATLGISGGKGLVSAAKGLTNRNIGSKIVNDANSLQSYFKESYGRLFKDAEHTLAEKLKNEPAKQKKKIYELQHHEDIPLVTKESPVHEGKKIIGAKNYQKFKLASDADINSPINDFIKNPSAENAHWAKSSVNTFQREMKRIKASRGLSPAENQAVNASKKIKTKISNYLDEHLSQLDPHLREKYKNLTNQFKEHMAPYLGNRDIRKARMNPTEEGFIEPFRLPSELYGKSGDPFLRALSEKYPELYYNRLLAGNAGKALLAGSLYKFGPKILGER